MLADKVREAINSPFNVFRKEIYASASIGISLYPQDGRSAGELIKAADIAMYSAKNKGKNAYQFFMPEMNRAVKEKLNNEESLRLAIEKGELEFYYQPKISMADDEVIKAEALIRWHKDNNEWVMPGDFIAIAEESGLIIPISFHVFELACEFIRRLENKYHKSIHISFNLSGRQFRQHDLAQRFLELAAKYGVKPEQIEFEITESVIMEDPDLAKVICQKMKSLGFKLSLDDFGTGYSSLSYIWEYPINSIKIDPSFIVNVETDTTNQAIIHAVLLIAKSKQLEVICEGVETQVQLDFLKSIGVEHIQGYYFSKPLNEQDFIRYLDKGAPKNSG